MRAFAVGALLFCRFAQASAQDDILLYGTITDYISGMPLQDARVVVASEASKRDTLFADSTGSYSIHVDYDHQWQLWYEAPGRVTKRVAIDARGIPEEDREGGHGMDIGMTLFLAEPGKDYSVLQDPMGIARYVDPTGNIEWDMAMVERMKRLIEPLLPDTTKTNIAVAGQAKKLEREPGPEPALVGVMLFLGLIVPSALAIWWFFLRQKR